MTNRRRVLVGVAVLVVVIVTAGVVAAVVRSRGETSATLPTGTATASSTAAPSATLTQSVAPTASGLSPLTGLPAPAGRPVLAVKIDNVPPARPQTGLGKADVVYVEPVEGGLSRIMAIFSSTVPPRVGPVRSARQSDLELLREYGRPGLAYSGANSTVLGLIRRAPVVDLSQDRDPTAYSRSSSRPAPHNLFADPSAVIRRGQQGAQSGRISAVKDIGFRFGPLKIKIGTPTARKLIRYPAASIEFTWSKARHRWDVTLDGRAAITTDGGPLGASTVVIQYTRITSSGLHDVLGNTTPYTHTVGSGKAVVLRDGLAIPARWSRATVTSGTTFSTVSGARLPFAAGQVWVVFAPS